MPVIKGGAIAGAAETRNTLTFFGRTYDVKDVLDVQLSFHMVVPVRLWKPLVGNASDVTGEIWRPPHGLPFDARLNTGELIVSPDFDLYVTHIACESRHVQLQFYQQVLDRNVTRTFSGPTLKGKGYRLLIPIVVRGGSGVIVSCCANRERSARKRGDRIQIDLSGLLVRVPATRVP